MATYIDDLKNKLKALKDVNDNNINEIKNLKKELQRVREDLFNSVKSGYYLRDDDTIIISAPRIIIGNVDHSGELYDGTSEIIIRGTKVNLQAPSNAGEIVTKAPTIKQIAVDPGADGLEEIAYQDKSIIISQAVGITLQSNKARYVNPGNQNNNQNTNDGAFVEELTGSDGINIQSDTVLNINAQPKCKMQKTLFESENNNLDVLTDSINTQIRNKETELNSSIDDLQKFVSEHNENDNSQTAWRANDKDLRDMHEYFIYAQDNLCKVVNEYSNLVSEKAEITRKKKVFTDNKAALPTEDTYKKSSGGSINIATEKLSYICKDGDRKLRENNTAGFFITAPNFQFYALTPENHTDTNHKGRLMKDSCFTIKAQNVGIYTDDPKKPSGEGNDRKEEIKATGQVTISSKAFRFEAVDTTISGVGEQQNTETKVVEKGKFVVTANKFKVDAPITQDGTNKDGNIVMNSKKVRIVSMDTEKENKKTKEKNITKDSELVIASDKMFVGCADDNKENMQSSDVQIISKKTMVAGNDAVVLVQSNTKNNAEIALSYGNTTQYSDSITLYGNTEYANSVTVKGEFKAPKGTFDEVDVKKKFSSPKINDGMVGAVIRENPKPDKKRKKEKPSRYEEEDIPIRMNRFHKE